MFSQKHEKILSNKLNRRIIIKKVIKISYRLVSLRDMEKNNYPGWRRVSVRIQGAKKQAYRDM
jgi:hypothetical protein